MKTPSRLIIALLSIATVVCAVFAYREHARQAASHSLVESLEKERAMLRQRLLKLEQLPIAPPPALMLSPSPDAAQKPSPATPPGTITHRQIAELRGEAGLGGGPSTNLMENPDVQKLMGMQQRAALDNRFAALFRQLKLSPADLEIFKNLLVEKQTAILDVRAAAQAQGINGRDGREVIRELLTDAQAEVDNSIRSKLGDAVFTQYQGYEQTLAERTAVTQLEQRLSYSASPLTSDQTERLIGILAETSPNRPAAPGSPGYNPAIMALRAMGNNAGVAAPITPAAITRSEGILNREQLAALRQLQQEQEAKQLLAQQIRTSGALSRPAGNTTPGSTTPPAHP